jgi:hypothetical protein
MGKELLRHGNVRPLVRFMLVAPIIGELVGNARAALGRRDRKWIWDENDWDEKLYHWFVQNPADAYGLGTLGDMMRAIGYGPQAMLEYAAGPGISQTTRAIAWMQQGAAKHAAVRDGTLGTERALERWYRDTARGLVGEISLGGRTIKGSAWTEAEQIRRMEVEQRAATHRAAELLAVSFDSVGASAIKAEKNAQKVLDEFNRKYQKIPGFVPVQAVTPDALREAIRARRETEEQTARRRAPKQQRGIQFPTLPGPGKLLDLLSSGPPGTQQAAAASAAALVAFGPGDKFTRFVEQAGQRVGVSLPPPAILELTASAKGVEAAERDRLVEALPPERQAKVRALLALRGQGSKIT